MEESNRIKELEQLENLANTFLNYYISKQEVKTKGWEKDLIKRNISLLTKSIQKIAANLHPEKISKYLQAIRSVAPESNKSDKEATLKTILRHLGTVTLQGNNFSLLMEIVRCSPRISYFNDLTWFRLGTVGEHIEFGLGKTDETVFEKYLPYQINHIEESKDDFFQKKYFKEDLILINSILSLLKEEKNISANILIITLIEGLVRKFCFLVYKKQNPGKSESEIDNSVYIGKSSFESLVCKTSWKKDIPVLFSELINEYSHAENSSITDFEQKFDKHKEANERIEEKLSRYKTFISEQLENKKSKDDEMREISLKFLDELEEESKNLMTEEDKTVMIGLDVYLDFLVKKFKDDRNNIIHGKYSFFKEKWRTLVYLSALETLINKIIWYEKNVSF